MKKDKTVEQMLVELDEKMNWFHSDDFKLEEASARFTEVTKLADDVEAVLTEMRNEIEVLAKDFTENKA